MTTQDIAAQLASLTPEARAALLAQFKPAAKPKYGPETRVLDIPVDSRQRESALKKIGWMKLELSAKTTLADVQAGVDAYNAANPGKLDAYQAKRKERMELAKAKKSEAIAEANAK